MTKISIFLAISLFLAAVSCRGEDPLPLILVRKIDQESTLFRKEKRKDGGGVSYEYIIQSDFGPDYTTKELVNTSTPIIFTKIGRDGNTQFWIFVYQVAGGQTSVSFRIFAKSETGSWSGLDEDVINLTGASIDEISIYNQNINFDNKTIISLIVVGGVNFSIHENSFTKFTSVVVAKNGVIYMKDY